MRARNSLQGKSPFCADCGSHDAHVVGNSSGGHLWLCGSCELLRANPDARLATNPPGLPSTWPGRGKQKERLF